MGVELLTLLDSKGDEVIFSSPSCSTASRGARLAPYPYSDQRKAPPVGGRGLERGRRGLERGIRGRSVVTYHRQALRKSPTGAGLTLPPDGEGNHIPRATP